MATEQKFKVGDMVVPVRLDKNSVDTMESLLGVPGVITHIDDSNDTFYKVHNYWWKNVVLIQPTIHQSQLIEKVKDLLFLVAGTEAGESEAVKDILYLIYKIQNEKK